jgi:hypothetical protein
MTRTKDAQMNSSWWTIAKNGKKFVTVDGQEFDLRRDAAAHASNNLRPREDALEASGD